MKLSDTERNTLHLASELLASKWREGQSKPLLIPHEGKPGTIDEVQANREAIRNYLQFRYAAEPREHFAMLLLDFHGRMIELVDVAKGSNDSVNVPMREAMKAALAADAANVVLVHNHPGGDATPSAQDISMTEDWAKIFARVGVNVQDHLVISSGGVTSIRAHLTVKSGRKANAREQLAQWGAA